MSGRFTSIEQADQHLLNYSPQKMSGQSYVLDRMRTLMNRLGDPQNKLNIIHIAGTSGKTSTAYYIRALLEASGMKTGLTASPHMISITERVQIEGEPLADETFLAYLSEFLAIVSRWKDCNPTYFELLIAFAYWVFEREHVNYAVIETGLGGTLDATNVVNRINKVCVITPIGLDHTQILGATVVAIAGQKAGIIGDGNHVFSAVQLPVVANILRVATDAKNGALHIAPQDITKHHHLPIFQRHNFALAYETFLHITQRDKIDNLSEEEIYTSTLQTPPGRYEWYTFGNKKVLLDGAHNPQKLTGLIAALADQNVSQASWVTAFIEAPDAKIHECMKTVATALPRSLILTEFRGGQDIKSRYSVKAQHLVEQAIAHGISHAHQEPDPIVAFEKALKEPAQTIVVTGSLYLASVLRPYLIKQSD